MTATATRIRAAAARHAARPSGPTIHLQGVGAAPAAPVRDLTTGDTLLWNYGTTTTVISCTQTTAKTWTLVERTREGQILSSSKRGTTLVGRVTRAGQ